MKNNLHKRGQKLAQKLNKFSRVASQSSQEHIKENLVDRLPHARNVRLLILEWSLLMSALILLAIAQSFWYSDSYSTDSFTNGGTYTEATLGKINSLNPLFATTNSEKTLSKLMFATLTETDYSGHTGFSLAESVVADETGKVWTIKLRDGLKWSDGEPITNKDVLFTVKLIQDPDVKSDYNPNLAKVIASEDETGNIVFSLPSAYVDFASALDIPVVPEHILKDTKPVNLLECDFSTTNPVTSGAFNYNASQNIDEETGEKIVYLTANEQYFNESPMINTFAVHAFETTEDIIKAINTSAVTATAELLPTDEPQITAKSIYKKETTLNNGVFAFINTSSPTLKDKSLRRAIQQGIDMKEIRSVLGDEPELNYPIADNQIKLNNYPALPAYDVESAKATIAAAGLDPEIPLAIATVNTGYLPSVANKLSEQLQALGFKTSVTPYEPDQDFISNIVRQRNYDILIYEIELGTDPDIFAYYHSSQASSNGINLSNYRNSLADDVVLAARNTMDEATRIGKYESFLKYWVDDAPAIGIYQTNMTYYFNKNTRNFSEDNHLVVATDRFEDISYWSAVQMRKNRTP